MPYQSKAQQRLFHVRPELKQYAPEWDQATKHVKGGFKKLPERVHKADDYDRAQHYGRMAGAMGTLGTTSAALGAGSGVVARMERKDKDPMGFTIREHAGLKPLSAAKRAETLGEMAAAHRWQAKTLGAVGAASLGAAAAYHVKHKRALAQPVAKLAPEQPPSPHRRLSQVAGTELGLGTAGVGAAAMHLGGKHGNMLRQQAALGVREARGAHHEIMAHKFKSIELAPHELAFAQKLRSTGARVAGVKGTGALAAGVATAAGGAGLYELARNRLARPKPTSSFGKAAIPKVSKVPANLVRVMPRNVAARLQALAPKVKPLSTKQKVIAGTTVGGLAAPLAVAAGMDEADRRRVGKASHWSDNLVAHHQAKLAYHQGQADRFSAMRGRTRKAHWADNLVAHHQARVAHHQGQLARLERFQSAPKKARPKKARR